MMKEEGGFKSYEKYSNDVEKGQPPIKIESYENPNYEAEISGRYMGGRTVEDFWKSVTRENGEREKPEEVSGNKNDLSYKEVSLMIVVTTENIPGYKVKEVKGEVFGLIVRSRGIGGQMLWSWWGLIQAKWGKPWVKW